MAFICDFSFSLSVPAVSIAIIDLIIASRLLVIFSLINYEVHFKARGIIA